VKNAEGKLLMECVLETKAATILEFIEGLRGSLSLTFEEGTSAAWLHDLLKPHVSRLVVCDSDFSGTALQAFVFAVQPICNEAHDRTS
jgi:hypothetical protein